MISTRRILGRAINRSSARGRPTDLGLLSAEDPSRKHPDPVGTAAALSVRLTPAPLVLLLVLTVPDPAPTVPDPALTVPDLGHSRQGRLLMAPLPAQDRMVQPQDRMALHLAQMVRQVLVRMVLHQVRMVLVPVRMARPRDSSVPLVRSRRRAPVQDRGFSGR